MARDLTSPADFGLRGTGIERFNVVITNRLHPHHGRRGYIEMLNGNVTVVSVLGNRMVRIEFTDHGVTDAAFASPGDFQHDPHAGEQS